MAGTGVRWGGGTGVTGAGWAVSSRMNIRVGRERMKLVKTRVLANFTSSLNYAA
jgi:hypothetical protein